MANLYLTEQGSVLCKTGDRLIVQKDKEVLLDIQCNKIDAVLVFGNVQITTQAVHELFKFGIELALLTRTGRLIGQLTSPATKNIELRVMQFKQYGDDAFKLELSKRIVSGKLTNCLTLLKDFSHNHPNIDFNVEITSIETSMKNVATTESLNSLRGVEGSAAQTYFKGFGKMILGGFTFEGRRKHPSTDPVNALLSFGYT